nr:hypothetical protein [Tanacetum cinerariifolium]
MDITIDQQVALDEALLPHASRIRIGKSNFRLRPYLKSKESTLQVVYDVLKLTPLYKAFLVTADIPEIYMQEFWATATVHHHSIRFKMNNKKRIVNLEYFKEMLQISPRIPNQQFDELPFEEEILAFLRELGYSGEIKMIIDGMYYKKSVDFAYLLWEDFVYQVKHKDAQKSIEMYYPRFTKVIVNFFMTKDQSIPRRNKVNWHFARDGHIFTTIKLVSRHQNTQQYGAILPVELTNKAIRNSKSYKEYYAIASGAEPPKTKASVGKKQSSSDTTMPPSTATGKRIKTSAKVGKPAKEKQPAKSSKAKGLTVLSEVALTEAEQIKLATKKSLTQTHISHASRSGADEGTGIIPGVPDIPTYEYDDEEISWKSVQTPSQVENIDDEDNDEDSHGMNVEGDKEANKEDKANELYRDVNINLEGIDSIFESTPRVDVPVTTTAEPPLLSATTLHLPSISVISHVQQPPASSPANVPSLSLQDLPNFGSLFRFDHRLKTLETNFSKFMQTNQFAEAISSILGSKSHHKTASESAPADEPMHTTQDLEEPAPQKFEIGVTNDQPVEEASQHPHCNLAKKADSHTSFNELMDTPVDFSAFVMNWLKVETLTPELLAGPTYELMKGSCKSLVEPEFFLEEPLPLIPNSRGRRVIPFEHFINNDLEYLRGGASIQKYTTLVTKTKAADYGHIKWIKDLFYGFAVNREPARDVYFKHRIIVVTELQIIEWHNYNHLDWITIRRDDNKLYKFKEGDFKRLRIQDIEEMLLLLVQGKLTNLTVDERFAFNVSLRMFTRSIDIQRRMKDLQLGVESYQKKLNLTKPDTYRSYLKRKEAYTTYSNPRGFIYQNKDKQSRLMRIDELHKFNDDTLNDVRTALDDRLKGIRMQYLPQTIWRPSDKDRAAAMIQAIDKQLKTRRIMRRLEKFVGERLYEGDFRLLQRTI